MVKARRRVVSLVLVSIPCTINAEEPKQVEFRDNSDEILASLIISDFQFQVPGSLRFSLYLS